MSLRVERGLSVYPLRSVAQNLTAGAGAVATNARADRQTECLFRRSAITERTPPSGDLNGTMTRRKKSVGLSSEPLSAPSVANRPAARRHK
jgi:hypothetical protein